MPEPDRSLQSAQAVRLQASAHRIVDRFGGGQVLEREADRLEHRDLHRPPCGRGARRARGRPGPRRRAPPCDRAARDRLHEVAALGQRRLAVVDDDHVGARASRRRRFRACPRGTRRRGRGACPARATRPGRAAPSTASRTTRRRRRAPRLRGRAPRSRAGRRRPSRAPRRRRARPCGSTGSRARSAARASAPRPARAPAGPRRPSRDAARRAARARARPAPTRRPCAAR